jgi:hypothetical protein
VYAVIDASSTWSSTAKLASMLHLMQAGAIVTNWIAIAAELKHDEDRETTPAMNKTFGEHMDLYGFLGDIAAAKA